MKVSQIMNLLGAEVFTCHDLIDKQLHFGFCADLMSDALAYATSGTLLITGLMNMQTLRTAEMLDVECILFVRNKKPTDEIIQSAAEIGIILLSTDKTSYESSGILYGAGLPAIDVREVSLT
ncbi:MAG: DRTGG domain-containing protein [Christensenellales bacterium]|jgi:hypothetical protein